MKSAKKRMPKRRVMANKIEIKRDCALTPLSNGKAETIFPKKKYIVVNLPKFNKTADEVENPVDAWLYVLKHAHEGDTLPDFGNGILFYFCTKFFKDGSLHSLC